MATKTQPKEETLFEKEKRLKNRKQVYKRTYKKGLFHNYPEKIIEYLKTEDIVVRVHSDGALDDDTGFVSITIEGIKNMNP